MSGMIQNIQKSKQQGKFVLIIMMIVIAAFFITVLIQVP